MSVTHSIARVRRNESLGSPARWRLRGAPMVVALVLSTSFATAQDDSAAYVAAVRENGELLVSGEFMASGEFQYALRGEPAEETRVFQEVIEGAFDYQKECIFFSRTRTQTVGKVAFRFGQLSKSWLVLTPEYSIDGRASDLVGDAANVTVLGPIAQEDAPPFFQPVLDVRSMAFSRYPALRIPFGQHMSGYERLEAAPTDGAVDGLHRVVLDERYPDTNVGERYTLWLDETQGFQPVRFTVQAVRFPVPQEVEVGPHTSIDAAWQHVNDVWVLKTVEVRANTPDGQETLRLAFTWRSVNDRVPEQRFQWQGLDLPQGSRVFDGRVTPPAVLERVGAKKERELASRNETPSALELTLMRRMLVSGSLILIALFLGFSLRRYRLRRSK